MKGGSLLQIQRPLFSNRVLSLATEMRRSKLHKVLYVIPVLSYHFPAPTHSAPLSQQFLSSLGQDEHGFIVFLANGEISSSTTFNLT